jgi:hypothetical protein
MPPTSRRPEHLAKENHEVPRSWMGREVAISRRIHVLVKAVEPSRPSAGLLAPPDQVNCVRAD